MSSTYTTLLSYLRTKIRETSAEEWTDAELTRYLSNAEQWLVQLLTHIPNSGRFIRQETITLPANTTSFSLTPGSNPTALVKTLTDVRDMYMVDINNRWIPLNQFAEGDENLYRVPTLQLVPQLWPPRYRIREDAIIFVPPSQSDRTIIVDYNWTPLAKTSGSDTADTPTQYDDLLVDRAAWDALSVQGEDDTSFDEKYATRIAEVEYYENNRGIRGVTETPVPVSSRQLFW